MANTQLKKNRIRRKNERKFIFTDVEACTLTFKDGLVSKIKPTPEEEIVLIKVISHTTQSKSLEECVLRNYMSAKNITELSHLCGYNCVKTFTRHFKKNFKQTPYQWILERKMEEVHFLVINSEIPISEISSMYGFHNQSHLTSLYNKYFGISPQKNRDQYK